APLEARDVVVCVRVAHWGEHKAGELVLHCADGGADRVEPGGIRQRIDVGGVIRPTRRKQFGAPGGVGLVPTREVTLYEVAHHGSFRSSLTPTIFRNQVRSVDYARGNGQRV